MTAALPAPTLETMHANRANPNPMLRPPLESPAWDARTIPGPAGAPDVEVVIVNAGDKGAPRPAILHTHGGGFLYMHPKDIVFMLQETAAALDCVIVSVDYRLAPETQFPGSLEDNYAALKWLYANADALGADPERIALMGESAGGGHAAMLAIAARDRGEVPVIYQALTYPMLDDRTGSTRAVPSHIGTFIWRAVENRFGWSCFLGVPAGSDTVPYGAVPARVDDLGGLPPTFIAVGAIDLFVEEDIEYARRLNAAGVPVELHVYPGCVHAFDALPTESAARFKAALLKALADAFAPRTTA
jgi:acetyl esterase/lipase